MYNVDNKLEKEKLLMKQQVYNPYLPLDTYIPDGEPHVFGDRLYIYGSHDAENGTEFCVLDYECFSAPVDDLSDWRSEGIIYHADQDPGRNEKDKYMYAPDVVEGNNGRMPFVTCRDDERFVADLCDDAVMGYKYFAFDGKVTLTVTYRGQGSVSVCDETKTLGELTLAPSVEWCKASVEITEKGTHALYLKTKGDTMCDILKLSFSR